MIFSRFGRLIIFSCIGMLFLCGCSGGGGSPVTTPFTEESTQSPTSDRDGCFGSAELVDPPLAWEITQPADLIEEGWGFIPATTLSELTFSASLYGENADIFNGDTFLYLDGKPINSGFQGNTLTAQLSGLDIGIHNLHMVASSGVGFAADTFRFEVVDNPPDMQIGIGEDDGKLYVSFSRPLPGSQLIQSSLWSASNFPSALKNFEISFDNKVIIELNTPVFFEDIGQLALNGFSPSLSFNSSLGEIRGYLFQQSDEPGGRHAQSSNCDKGYVTDWECVPSQDWVVDREHLASGGRENRQALNVEGWYPWVVEPWSDCFNYTVVRYNCVREGHLDWADPANWLEPYDTQWHSGGSQYSGIGYPSGVWQKYYRDFGYCLETCEYMWELTVDCNNCGANPYDPPGYESKGWNIDLDWIYVDHEPPVFDEVKFVPAEEINQYVGDVLIPELTGELTGFGAAYAANGSSDLQAYYDQRLGDWIDDWLVSNPGGLCLVVKAQDAVTDEGRWICPEISVDYEEGGQRYFLDDEELHMFYVDIEPYAADELSDDMWPEIGAGGLFWEPGCPEDEFNPDCYLPTDGLKTGEYSAWVIPVDCAWFHDYSSCRLRVRDEINNWRRTDDLALEEYEVEVTVEVPDIECGGHVQAGNSVEFEANIVGPSDAYELVEPHFLWYVLKWDDNLQDWVEYGPHCEPGYQYSNSDYDSLIHEDEDWVGVDFKLEAISDPEFHVRAKLIRCGAPFWGDCMVYDDPEVLGLMFRENRYPDPGPMSGPGYNWSDEYHWDYTANDDNTVAPDRRSEDQAPGDGFVVSRQSGVNSEVQLYACVEGQLLGHYILVTVSAPYDGPSNGSIQVELYELDPSDPDHDEILADFDEEGIIDPNLDLHVYGRGNHVYHPSITGSPPNIQLSDTQPSSQGIVTFGTPILHVSNNDNVHDYSRLVANDPPSGNNFLTQSRWSWLVSSFHYGGNLRGYFAWNNYNGVDGQQNYKDNVLEIGQEVIKAKVGEKDAFLPVQSWPDIAFFFAHGGPINQQPPSLGCTNIRDLYQFVFSHWPTQPGAPASAALSITPYEIADSCPPGSDTEWIVLYGCNALHIGQYYVNGQARGVMEGYDDWECIVGSGTTSITAVCGFKGEPISYAWTEDFADKFSYYLNNPGSLPPITDNWDLSYSGGQQPQEAVVIAWMEAAIWYINAWTGKNEGGFMKDACAVSVDGMWILEDSNPDPRSWDYKARKR